MITGKNGNGYSVTVQPSQSTAGDPLTGADLIRSNLSGSFILPRTNAGILIVTAG